MRAIKIDKDSIDSQLKKLERAKQDNEKSKQESKAALANLLDGKSMQALKKEAEEAVKAADIYAAEIKQLADKKLQDAKIKLADAHKSISSSKADAAKNADEKAQLDELKLKLNGLSESLSQEKSRLNKLEESLLQQQKALDTKCFILKNALGAIEA